MLGFALCPGPTVVMFANESTQRANLSLFSIIPACSHFVFNPLHLSLARYDNKLMFRTITAIHLFACFHLKFTRMFSNIFDVAYSPKASQQILLLSALFFETFEEYAANNGELTAMITCKWATIAPPIS